MVVIMCVYVFLYVCVSVWVYISLYVCYAQSLYNSVMVVGGNSLLNGFCDRLNIDLSSKIPPVNPIRYNNSSSSSNMWVKFYGVVIKTVR